MKQRKPFSILKWLVFPSLSLALAACIAWFNIRAFGWEDGAIYLLIVAVITAFSIAINKYVRLADDDDESNDRLAVAAFIFEILLTAILAVNAAYSLSVQREMSIARQAEGAQSKDLESVSRFRDRRAQRESARMLREQSQGARSSQQIFAENERMLFWIMVGETLAYMLSAFTLLAVATLTGQRKRQNRSVSDDSEKDALFPAELDLDASERQTGRRSPSLRAGRQVATPVATDTDIDRLRAYLKEIAFYHPGRWFKADPLEAGDGLWVRLCERRQGREVTIAKVKWNNRVFADLDRPDFAERLRQRLIEAKFPIGGEQ